MLFEDLVDLLGIDSQVIVDQDIPKATHRSDPLVGITLQLMKENQIITKFCKAGCNDFWINHVF